MMSVSRGRVDSEAHHVKKWIELPHAGVKEYAEYCTKAFYSNSLWVPRYRAEENFFVADHVVLDFDGITTIEQVADQLSAHPHVFAPTRSHRLVKRVTHPDGRVETLPPQDRFRVMLPLDRPCFVLADLKHTSRELCERLGADTNCVGGAMAWRPSKSVWRVQESGSPVPLLEAPPAPEPEPMGESKRAKAWALGVVPRSVRELLDGRVSDGRRNASLFAAASDLFECGFEYLQVFELFSTIPWFSDAGGVDTLRSAAKKKGVPYM